MSLSIKKLIFNAFQVNSYVISNPGGDAIIVDPACYTPREQEQLSDYIEEQGLNLKHVINTHSHVDHVLGNGYIYARYGLKPMIHKAGLIFYGSMESHANTFGFQLDQVVHPDEFLDDGQEIVLGEDLITVAYTPGHADGSICLISEADRWIIAGDLIFYLSIGRTDLPTGNLERLLSSVKNKIMCHEDDFIIYPGHGNATTVGFERRNNPYL